MLRDLVEYARREPGRTPVGYRVFSEPVRWFLEVGVDGKGRLVEGDGNPPRPYLKRTNAVSALLLIDEAKYVLGKSDGKSTRRAQESFESFWSLMEDAHRATGNSELGQILKVRDHWPPEGMDRVAASDVVGVRVQGGTVPIADPSVQSFWLAHSIGEAQSSIEGQCGVCGKVSPLLRRLPFGIKGFDQDVQISSFNLEAFQSYGKEQGLNAPTCAECGSLAAAALSQLLRNQSPNKVTLQKGEGLGRLTAVFWCRTLKAEAEDVGEFDVLEALKAPIGNSNEGTAPLFQDLGKVRTLLRLPWKPKVAALSAEPDAFHMLVLSNNFTRLVVRAWIQGSLEETKSKLGVFLEGALMVGPMGEAPSTPSISTMLSALGLGNPNLARTLVEGAYAGRPLPESLSMLAATRLRNPTLWTERGQSWRTQALLSLVRIQRCLDPRAMPGTFPTANLEPHCTSPAYLCGRLLAVLERAQGVASSWGVGASVVDRAFGAAAVSPRISFPPLLKIAVKAHLPSAGKATRDAMDEVMASLDAAGGFPTTLTLSQQADFALGFYHQRAAFRSSSKLQDVPEEPPKEKK